MIFAKSFNVIAFGPARLFDLTKEILRTVESSEIREGQVLIFSVGSTGTIIKMPYDGGVMQGFITWVKRNIPAKGYYRHPGNAVAHLRSTFLGTSIVVPLVNGEICLNKNSIFLLENTPTYKSRPISIIINGVE
ncbi:MAG: YjbQ family protein [Actinobacteria bacterium]|nr:YjbQ family protein [Actinomycetota bacterium]